MINFVKMHGNGNDFIMVNSLEQDFKPKKALIRNLGDRNLGIGFDQMIHIGLPTKENKDFYIKFYNADGSQASMCLNGIRCAASYIWDQKFAPKKSLCFQTKTRDVECNPINNGVEVIVSEAKSFSDSILEKKIKKIVKDSFALVDSGNLHLCIQRKNITKFDLDELYNKLASHIQPLGINLSVYSKGGKDIDIRTYENGVGETLSCGSASFSVACLSIKDNIKKVTIKSSGGSLKFRKVNENIFMSGPTKFVYSGSFNE
jgi:diaminopimelate epimerase